MPDKEMMETPLEWSGWPFLPLKKFVRDGFPPEIGFIFNGAPTRVYRKGIYGPHDVVDLSTIPYDSFASVDDVIAAGWIVD